MGGETAAVAGSVFDAFILLFDFTVANKVEIIKCGGVDALLRALSRHPENAAVNDNVSLALGNLANKNGECAFGFLSFSFTS